MNKQELVKKYMSVSNNQLKVLEQLKQEEDELLNQLNNIQSIVWNNGILIEKNKEYSLNYIKENFPQDYNNYNKKQQVSSDYMIFRLIDEDKVNRLVAAFKYVPNNNTLICKKITFASNCDLLDYCLDDYFDASLEKIINKFAN